MGALPFTRNGGLLLANEFVDLGCIFLVHLGGYLGLRLAVEVVPVLADIVVLIVIEFECDLTRETDFIGFASELCYVGVRQCFIHGDTFAGIVDKQTLNEIEFVLLGIAEVGAEPWFVHDRQVAEQFIGVWREQGCDVLLGW
jgi:hypothetical protein